MCLWLTRSTLEYPLQLPGHAFIFAKMLFSCFWCLYTTISVCFTCVRTNSHLTTLNIVVEIPTNALSFLHRDRRSLFGLSRKMWPLRIQESSEAYNRSVLYHRVSSRELIFSSHLMSILRLQVVVGAGVTIPLLMISKRCWTLRIFVRTFFILVILLVGSFSRLSHARKRAEHLRKTPRTTLSLELMLLNFSV